MPPRTGADKRDPMKTSPRSFPGLLAIMAAALLATVSAAGATAARERLLMDFGWRFHLGNDWGAGQNLAKAGSGYGPASVDLQRRQLAARRPAARLGGRAALRSQGRCEPRLQARRRRLPAKPASAGTGARSSFRRPMPAGASGSSSTACFRDCTVFVNGWFVGHHESGYGGFRYDITDVAACGGKNVVAVRVDATQSEGWFYEGAGIYRHVWLVKTAPLAIAPDGVFVFSAFKNNVPGGPADDPPRGAAGQRARRRRPRRRSPGPSTGPDGEGRRHRPPGPSPSDPASDAVAADAARVDAPRALVARDAGTLPARHDGRRRRGRRRPRRDRVRHPHVRRSMPTAASC